MPLLVGIVNVTPDSFSDGGLYGGTDTAVAHALSLLDQGADWVDIGGESTRPGAAPVPPEVERDRVLPVVAGVHAARPEAILSIDTRRAAVAEAALAAGASVVNDVSALSDPDMAGVCSAADCQLVLMHHRGTPDVMQDATHYDDLAADVLALLQERIARAWPLVWRASG